MFRFKIEPLNEDVVALALTSVVCVFVTPHRLDSRILLIGAWASKPEQQISRSMYPHGTPNAQYPFPKLQSQTRETPIHIHIHLGFPYR